MPSQSVEPKTDSSTLCGEALSRMKSAFGGQSEFREGQWEAIEALLQEGRRLLVVQRTGWGKSAVYFLATKFLRERGAGPTLIVSPLLALMRNQIEMAKKLGVRAASINSTNVEDWAAIEKAVLAGNIDALLLSPERLGNPQFQKKLLPRLEQNAGLLVIDEAHCISDWGHDFRPDYRRIVSLIKRLNPWASILATTATANDRVIEDLHETFGEKLEVRRGPMARKKLRLFAFHYDDHAERLAWMAKYLPKLPGTGIVYTLTVADAEQAARWLQSQDIDARAYHADLSHPKRLQLEEQFVENRLKALVATSALGMGYDKEDVGFVVHYQMPGSLAAYYQQVGRAGRASKSAFGVLLSGSDDEEVSEHFIESAFPPQWVFQTILQGLGTGPKSSSEIASNIPAPLPIVRQALEILEADGTIEATTVGFQLARDAPELDWARFERLRKQREAELAQMRGYARAKTCRMRILADALGDSETRPCGECDNCRAADAPVLDPKLTEKARAFLSSQTYVIAPRSEIPPGAQTGGPKSVPKRLRFVPGIALSSYNDPGWGRMVKAGKYESLEYSDELIEAAFRALARSDFKPQWLTWVPSARHDAQLRAFAERLAKRLQIAIASPLKRARKVKLQKLMQTPATQFENAWESFEAGDVQHGEVLLLDDVVDSGWTLAAAAATLRSAGSGEVMPLALATARPRRPRD